LIAELFSGAMNLLFYCPSNFVFYFFLKNYGIFYHRGARRGFVDDFGLALVRPEPQKPAGGRIFHRPINIRRAAFKKQTKKTGILKKTSAFRNRASAEIFRNSIRVQIQRMKKFIF
jgi:hypothetical protein